MAKKRAARRPLKKLVQRLEAMVGLGPMAAKKKPAKKKTAKKKASKKAGRKKR